MICRREKPEQVLFFSKLEFVHTESRRDSTAYKAITALLRWRCAEPRTGRHSHLYPLTGKDVMPKEDFVRSTIGTYHDQS